VFVPEIVLITSTRQSAIARVGSNNAPIAAATKNVIHFLLICVLCSLKLKSLDVFCGGPSVAELQIVRLFRFPPEVL
jgi:hypothetical protein